MSSDSYRLYGQRIDGSRLKLWNGNSARDAYKAEKLMRVLGGGYTEVYLEKNGKRWVQERANGKSTE